MKIRLVLVMIFAMSILGCQSAPKSDAPARQAWINDVGRDVAVTQRHLQDISLAGQWSCAFSRSANAAFYQLLQSGPVALLTDVAVARKLQASVAKLRYAATTAPYVLATPQGPVYLFVVENNSDNARFFSTRYNLAFWAPGEPIPGLFPLREMTLDDFRDNRVTFKKDTGASADDATCGPKQGSFFPK